jgi:hypothetical protein
MALFSNMAWPALYVSSELGKFWYLVFVTISVEAFAIKTLIRFTWTKSIVVSIVGNLFSGIVGTFIMIFAMVFWHALFDKLVPQATFDIINWVATYVLMCLGSVAIEVVAVKFIYKEPFKRLFLPLLIGNLLTYLFIASLMALDAKIF